MLIGYAPVPTDDQDFALQEDALKNAGCKKIYYDKMSGAGVERLGRSLKNLIELMNLLEERGIGFQGLQESIDTTTSGGKLISHIFGALAEFERNLNPRANEGRPGSRQSQGKERGKTQSA